MPKTIMFYIGKHFLIHVFGVMLAIGLIAGLFDLIELFRRASGKLDIPVSAIFLMGILKLPSLVQQLLPLMVLFGGLLCFTKLAKARELVVARSVGISVWQILIMPFLLAVLLGLILISVFNPISASFYDRFERLEGKYLTQKESTIEISATGIWLRDYYDGHMLVLNAKKLGERNEDGQYMLKVTANIFDAQENFLYRLDAEKALLRKNGWIFPKAKLSKKGNAPIIVIDHVETGNLSAIRLDKNFAAGQSLSFWELQEYIKRMDNAGFRSISYQLQFHALAATPLLLGVMALIAAIFTLKSGRIHKLFLVLMGGFVAGFVLFIFTHIMNALGLNETLPASLAGWTPSLIALALSGSLLLHLEDG